MILLPARKWWRPEFGWARGGRPPAERMRCQRVGEGPVVADLLERLGANMSHHRRSERYETCWKANKEKQKEFLSLVNTGGCGRRGRSQCDGGGEVLGRWKEWEQGG